MWSTMQREGDNWFGIGHDLLLHLVDDASEAFRGRPGSCNVALGRHPLWFAGWRGVVYACNLTSYPRAAGS